MGRSLFVAGLQSAGVPGDPAATLARFERDVRALRSTFPGLELVVAPELHLMALPPLLEEGGVSERELAVDVPGELTERLGALARETGLWLIPGSVYERAGDGVANTAVVLSPAGELVASYRKCFPWQPYETSVPGTRTVCFDIDGVGRFGLAICHDGVFPEIFRSLAWQGAEAIFQVTLTGTSDRDAETVVARANAYVNQVAVVNVNAAAPVGNGRSLVVDAEGAVRYEAGVAEEVLTAVLDLDAVARVRERGAFGINRLWEEMDRVGPGLDLPCTAGATCRAETHRRSARRGRSCRRLPKASQYGLLGWRRRSPGTDRRAPARASPLVRRCERHEDLAAPVVRDRAGARESEPDAPRKALQVLRGSGASVATTPMQLPAAFFRWSGGTSPGATPLTRSCSGTPKFVSSRTPTVCSPVRRLAVPMPPFQPKQLIPVPAPTAPRSKSRPAVATAFATSAGWTCAMRASESQLSSHSPTTGSRRRRHRRAGRQPSRPARRRRTRGRPHGST